jgi:hypothetical protein
MPRERPTMPAGDNLAGRAGEQTRIETHGETAMLAVWRASSRSIRQNTDRNRRPCRGIIQTLRNQG